MMAVLPIVPPNPTLSSGILASSAAQRGEPVETGEGRPYLPFGLDQYMTDPSLLALGRYIVPGMAAIQWGGGGVQEGPTDEPLPPPDPYTNPGLVDAAYFLPGRTEYPVTPPPTPSRTELPIQEAGSTKYETPSVEQGPNVMYAVKEKAGNWLPNEVDNLIDVIKYDTGISFTYDEGMATNQEILDRRLEELNDPNATERDRRFAKEAIDSASADIALENWMDTKLRKYIQTDMGTLNDPMLKLLDQYSGPLTSLTDPVFDAAGTKQKIRSQDAEAGRERVGIGSLYNPVTGEEYDTERPSVLEAEKMGLIPSAAQYYEDSVDSLINSYPMLERAGEFIRSAKEPYPEWIKNLPRETRLHSFKEHRVKDRLEHTPWGNWGPADAEYWGNHTFPEMSFIIKTLRHAVYDSKGVVPQEDDYGYFEPLPHSLRLDEKKLQKMSVVDATTHALKIKRWQEKNAQAKDLKRTIYAMEKSYPEEGFSWKRIGGRTDDPATTKEIEEALRYEGGSLVHCIGKRGSSYCQAITQGTSEVFSLRDAENNPKVTIQVSVSIPQEIRDSIVEQVREDYSGRPRMMVDSAIEMALTRWSAQNPDKLVRSVKEIKSLANTKPADKYIPFVQDFITNGPYRIDRIDGDLEHSDLVPVNSLSDSERGVFFARNPEFVGEFIPKQMLGDREQGYAKGGLVTKNGCSSGLCAADFLPK